MFLRYWWQVIKRALWGSIVFLGFSRPSRFAIALALFVVAVVVLQAIWGGRQMEDEIRWGLATLIAAAIFFIPTFIVNLLYAPAKTDKDKVDKIAGLQDEIAEQAATKTVADMLAAYYYRLSELIAERITSAKQFKDWDKRREEWWQSTTEYIRKNIALSESALFSRVSYSTREDEKHAFENQYNEAHKHKLIGLGVLSEKLEKLMTEYSKRINQSAVDK